MYEILCSVTGEMAIGVKEKEKAKAKAYYPCSIARLYTFGQGKWKWNGKWKWKCNGKLGQCAIGNAQLAIRPGKAASAPYACV